MKENACFENVLSKRINENAVVRLTALWAFSESALGGFLHMFKIPFTGAIINSVSAILIIMIASFSVKKGTILKATLLVMAVKAAAAPYTPVNAFVSVLFQGVLGELLLTSKRFLSVKAVLFASLTLLQSAIQRIVVLTVIMGFTFWESIDIFGGVMLKKIGVEKTSFLLSWFLIFTYILLYFLIGMVVGIIGRAIPLRVCNRIEKGDIVTVSFDSDNVLLNNIVKKKRKRYKVRMLPLFLVLSLAGSYFIPEISFFGKEILIMTIRYFIIMALWTFWAGPFLLERGKKVLQQQSYKYKEDIDFLVALLPKIRKISSAVWRQTKNQQGFRRFFVFFEILFTYIISVEEL
jgi:hypothetical protein